MTMLRRAWLPVVCAVLQTVSVGTGPSAATGAASQAASVVGVLAGLAMFGRERAPFLVLGAAVIAYPVQVALGGPAVPVVIAVMLYLVARRADVAEGRWSRDLVGTAGALIVGPASVVGSLALAGRVTEASFFGLSSALAVIGGLLHALRATREMQRRRELLTAERLRLARDLHDVVGHGMGAITVAAGAARIAVAAGAVEDATRSLAAIESAGRSVLREVRWLVGLLRDDEEHPTLADVRDLVGNARRSGLDVALNVEGDVETVPVGAGEAAYRIVQEALTNVIRHCRGNTADVVIRIQNHLVLSVRDRGGKPGSASSFEEGNGMRGMRERAGAVGGTFRAGPEPDGSWVVHAELPLGRSR